MRVTHIKNLIANSAAVITASLLLGVSASATAEKTVTIQTDYWPPYINHAGEPEGSAAKIIDLILDYQQLEPNWHYMPYELSLHYVKTQKQLLAFPFFKTEDRKGKVLFSKPVFSATSRLYFNRQFLTEAQAREAFNNKSGQQRIGKVAGYSYGESIDASVKQAASFASETQALTALFNGDIDVLPMTESVMNHNLDAIFPLRKQLILPISGVSDTSSLHVIAAKTKQGEALIATIDQALATLSAEGVTSLQAAADAKPTAVDVARLITTEGYPLIIGQTAPDGPNVKYYTLPQGSQVLITEWSKKIIEPSKTDRIYKNMMDLSKVVILNGPHVGKELFVRNMHIELM